MPYPDVYLVWDHSHEEHGESAELVEIFGEESIAEAHVEAVSEYEGQYSVETHAVKDQNG